MKKQYIKPQSKAVAIKSVGFFAASPDRVYDDPTKRATVLNSREGNSFEDDEEEDTGGWFK